MYHILTRRHTTGAESLHGMQVSPTQSTDIRSTCSATALTTNVFGTCTAIFLKLRTISVFFLKEPAKGESPFFILHVTYSNHISLPICFPSWYGHYSRALLPSHPSQLASPTIPGRRSEAATLEDTAIPNTPSPCCLAFSLRVSLSLLLPIEVAGRGKMCLEGQHPPA